MLSTALVLLLLAVTLDSPAARAAPQRHAGHPADAASPGPDAAASTPLPDGWTEHPAPVAGDAFAPYLASRGASIVATWIEPVAAGGHRVRFAQHAGGVWSAAATVRESDRLFANWADTPGAAFAEDGAIYVWWLEKSAAANHAYDIHLARSTDGGASFAPLGIAHEDRSPAEHGFVSAIAEGNGVRLFYLDGRATGAGGPMQLRTVAVSGEQIGASEAIDDSVCDCCWTAAARTASGAAVIYRDRDAREIRDIRLARRDATGALSSIPVGDDRWKIAGCPVNGPAIAVDGERLAVAWYAAPGDQSRVAMAISGDGGASLSPARLLDRDKPAGRVALATTRDGFAIAWLARREGGADLRFLTTAADGTPGAAITLARVAAGRASGVPRLVRSGDTLWLAWTEPAPRGLRFAAIPVGGAAGSAGPS